jgi:uncharacterized ParB-like nuclease family protein
MIGDDFRHAGEITETTDSDSYDLSHITDHLPVQEVPIGSIEHGLFLRGTGTDPAHVQLLLEAAHSGELPPILVQKRNLRIVDGLHRLEAAKLRGEKMIRARLINCSDEDAFILAVKSNTLHGLPLSRADRILGAKRILTWHPDWSDRAIGAAAGLSAKTIASLRYHSAGSTQQSGKRLGRDGKRRPLSSSEGRRRAAEYIAARPDASLRDVARATDVSLGTAHDVRARMRRGADPVLVDVRGSHSEQVMELPAVGPSAGHQPPADIPRPRGMRRDVQQPTWGAVSPKLAKDPSLKYSERGKDFFRWMTQHATKMEGWRDFIDTVPAHWMKDLSVIASDIAGEWHEFAEQLKNHLEQAV